jgi:transposase
MDNNRGEQSIRGPVNGRKGYYGSASRWSAALAATVFSLFQSLDLWGIPVRAWLTGYLQACAGNAGQPPADITPFLPWSLAEAPRTSAAPSSSGPSTCPAPDTS